MYVRNRELLPGLLLRQSWTTQADDLGVNWTGHLDDDDCHSVVVQWHLKRESYRQCGCCILLHVHAE